MRSTLLPTATRHHCGARVRWVHTHSGGPLLIDAEPQHDGTVMLVLGDDGWTAEARRAYRALALRARGLELFKIHDCRP
jgi:hypothetical protein